MNITPEGFWPLKINPANIGNILDYCKDIKVKYE
jgi:hypothetical protein